MDSSWLGVSPHGFATGVGWTDAIAAELWAVEKELDLAWHLGCRAVLLEIDFKHVIGYSPFTETLSFIFSEMYYNNEYFYSSLFLSRLCLMCLAYFKFENHDRADGVCFCIVAVIAPNAPAVYETYFGVPMAGAVVNCVNIRLNAETVVFLLGDKSCDPKSLTFALGRGAIEYKNFLESGDSRGRVAEHCFGLYFWYNSHPQRSVTEPPRSISHVLEQSYYLEDE
ncbi:hypothetical protein D5086_020142 [Populus alba]|uniref:Uncharacterized protein n=1 Tax=Populus alba TaxID=43335 RepID=A0ACC4BJ74_POPAL